MITKCNLSPLQQVEKKIKTLLLVALFDWLLLREEDASVSFCINR